MNKNLFPTFSFVIGARIKDPIEFVIFEQVLSNRIFFFIIYPTRSIRNWRYSKI